ncbi:MAG: hypothetical protein KIT16_01330 [Rhodospirillaceae bacterium]|nr:hypothetical protein [Rhodospirillaceae bacterium]
MARLHAEQDRYRLNRWTAAFSDPETETAYRRYSFNDWRWLNRLAFTLTGLAFILHTATDHWLYGFSATFFALLTTRLVIVGILLLAYPLTAGTTGLARRDTGIFALQLLVVGAYFALVLMMPRIHLVDRVTVQSVTTMLILFGQYFFVSTRVPYSVAAGLACSAAYFAMTVATDRLSPPAMALEIAVHAFANVLGTIACYRSAALRRRQFALLSRQEELNRRLEAQGQSLEAAAAELEGARDRAQHANRAKSEFLAYMSHELRSPMNAIIGFSEIMKREVFGRISPPKYRDYAEDIHGSATHLLSLINDILDLSKAEAGKLVVQETPVDLAAMAETARRLVRVRAEASGVTLRTQIAPNLPPLMADERMVKQMVLNLLSNAIKFTPAGGTVTIAADGDAAGALTLAVSDTGCGIPAEEIPRILEPYGRTRSAERSDTEGTGLGLTLVKAMAEVHGARLDIASEANRGSTFALHFPRERTGMAEAA